MKGTSTLQVTEATIIAAVQMYLDDQFAAGKSPVVTGVKPRNGVGNGDGYVIVVEERRLTPGDVLDKLRPRPDDPHTLPAGANGSTVELYPKGLVPVEAYNKRMVGGDRHDG